MRNFKSKLQMGIAALLLAVPTPVLHAQTPWYIDAIASGNTDAVNFAAVGQDRALVVKYVGTTGNSGTVTVAANGDLTLSTGPVGGSTADATVKCPSGAGNGIIDVSDTACDTLKEVVDAINASANWVAVPLDGLGTDDMNMGGTGGLITLAETAANGVDGLALLWDTVTTFRVGRLFTGQRYNYSTGSTNSIRSLMNAGKGMPLPDPYIGKKTFVLHANINVTYGSGTSSLVCYSVRRYFASPFGTTFGGNGANMTRPFTLTEIVVPIFTQANAATTVAKAYDTLVFGPGGLPGLRDSAVLCRVENSAALSAITNFYVYGVETQAPK